MSAHNFWNNFSHGFMHGMFNSNPFLGCYGGFGTFGCFGQNPFGCGSFGGGFGNCSNWSIFMTPNVMSFGYFPLMQNFAMPNFSMMNYPTMDSSFLNITMPDASDIFKTDWSKVFKDQTQEVDEPEEDKDEDENENVSPETEDSDEEIAIQNNAEDKEKKVAEDLAQKQDKEPIAKTKEQTVTPQTVTTPQQTPITHAPQSLSSVIKDEKHKQINIQTTEITQNKRTNNNIKAKNYEEDEIGLANNSENDKKKYDYKELKQKWLKKKPNLKLSDKFYKKIIKISKKIKCDPNDLMGIINLETRGTFSPTEQNPDTKATGLIQIMPKFAHEYDTSIKSLLKMTAEEQLDIVEKYFVKNIKRYKVKGEIDAITLYSLVFCPAYSNKPNDFVIAKKGSKTYAQNPSLDYNGDNKITKSDFAGKMREFRA